MERNERKFQKINKRVLKCQKRFGENAVFIELGKKAVSIESNIDYILDFFSNAILKKNYNLNDIFNTFGKNYALCAIGSYYAELLDYKDIYDVLKKLKN